MRAIAITCVLMFGCASTVPQDRSTGPDGRIKGAAPITLENGEGKAKGIVTYPGGDRVDWKLVELPPGKHGRLELAMKWTTPRPGLQLGFDVFDAWNQPVAVAKGSRGRSRAVAIDGAKGKYFVRVYAKRRGDAGAYQLAVAFREDLVAVPKDLFAVIPDPPRLAAVPDPDPVACTPGTPGCAPVTPPPPVTPPVVTPPPPPQPPVVVAKPITARVLKVDITGDAVLVTIGAGSDHGVDKTWGGTLLRGTTNVALTGGKLTIIRVDRQRTIAKVGLTVDLVTANPMILLAP